MRRRRRCGPSNCTWRSSAPARPASSWRRNCTARRASWWPTGSTASMPTRTCRLILIEAAERDPAGVAAAPVAGDAKAARASSASRCAPPRKVAEVLPDGVRLADGRDLPAELVVWAAGVKAPDFLKDIAGLETNRINQLVVLPTLQTTRDENIFAIGDCAACAWPRQRGQGRLVPPRAQAAHQQASHMVEADQAPPGRQAADAVALPRLRLAGLARRVQHRRQHDGRADRRQPDGSKAGSRA